MPRQDQSPSLGPPGIEAIEVKRGSDELRRLLQEQSFDLRTLDLAGFRRWLDRHLARWQNDPVFVQRSRIRELRRAHPRLPTLEEAHRRAGLADAASTSFARLKQLERQLSDTGKALLGLSGAMAQAGPEKRHRLQQKIDLFQARQQVLQKEQTRLVQSSQERQALLRISAELQQFRTEIGLDQEEAQLAHLMNHHGRRSSGAGQSFEQRALELTQSCFLPAIRAGVACSGSLDQIRVLRGVTLGAASIEFDQLVVRLGSTSTDPVEVLALVEVKRNINDLAHGFRRRQADLAWLTWEADRYDPQQYRTGRFRSGHFDREAVHTERGEAFRFAPSSFCLFRRDPATGLFLDRLHFITRTGTLWGASAAALARIMFRVATDLHWQPDSDSYLHKLLRWCQGLAQPLETPDMLQMYTSTPARGEQILIVEK